MGRVDKVVLISGGAQGMGAAHAKMLVAEGAKVVIGDILDEKGEALAAEIGILSTLYVHLDVTQADQWQAAVDLAVQTYGKLTTLVNNAGIVALGKIGQFDMDKFRKVIDVNLIGTVLGMQAVVEQMKAVGGGSIINVSSIEGCAEPRWCTHTSRRSGRSADWQVGGNRVGQVQHSINSVHPGFIRTPMTKHFPTTW
jgi:3alpha(or 20beta)-hydroxysteroid dehydrogenase